MEGGVDVCDVVSYLWDQLEILKAKLGPTVFLLGFFFCPPFLGFTLCALFAYLLGLGALYLAIALPVLPALLFLAWCLFPEVIPGDTIAEIVSGAIPRGYLNGGVQRRRAALRKELLKLCDESFLGRRAAQLARGYRVTDVRLNAHLRVTSYMLNRFLDTLLQHEDTIPGLCGYLRLSPILGPFVVAFHGTPPRNIPSILAHGLLPTSRESDPLRDYFSTDLAVTRQYVDRTQWYRNCPARFQAVVFLLLKKEADMRDYPFITVRQAAYQLPLGVVTVEAGCGP
ncbi:hypothetical protein KFL_001410230 [Klebsormidium nitens]|uniref:Uncharacterized protein n=1 Tax=Klebsormidium nitens TaxID=105231 RepID=A0A0U9HJU7_KLENI|nr:hypothetical protein KFL_001410230 [Klebsormidium nitens]|eukprot:GAQ83266.1 hypothetical protein KFL_001410230 [Klebsormidium nitens]